MGMSPSVASLFCFSLPRLCSLFYQSFDTNVTIVFYDKSSAEIPVFSSGFYLSVNIKNMAKIRNSLINKELSFC